MKALLLLALLPIFFLSACQKTNPVTEQAQAVSTQEDKMLSIATFAGGCFWCTEADFEKLPGVAKVISGYTGGAKINPTYEEVSAGATGHVEAVQVYYDPAKLTYEELVDYFWKHIDPTDGRGQFVDRGGQYTSAIFYHDEAQKLAAEKSKDDLSKTGWFDKPIATRIVKFTQFYPAEDYHQDYYKKNPIRYGYYRNGSGRDQFLTKTWNKAGKPHPPAPSPQAGKGGEKAVVGANNASPKAYEKPDEATLRKKLNPLQYQVTQKEGTEPAFSNEYWDNKKEGIYVDVVSGEPLFSSRDKFDSGTGWPSFTRPLEPANITEREDRGLFTKRTEVRSKHGDSHLGHVFNDGPAPTGLRYCMNSAALRFIPKEDLVKEGYGEYAGLFEKVKAGK